MQVLPKLASDLNITEFEYNQICGKLNREPNEFELSLFSAMWSEHCGYKYSRKLLDTLYKKGAAFCDENAGGIELGEYTLVFKTESHNHPSAVEPFNGAATGIGGIIRDVLAMNARPVAIMNSLKFGPIANPANKRLLDGVVDGISSYGNCIGVPNIGGETEFLPCYDEQPLVNVLAVGLVKTDELVTSKSGAGLNIVLLGSKTGRDGLGGAAFASKELASADEDRLSVQIADPFTKKKLIEATLEILNLDGVKSCQDCGAAGILSSTSEMGYKSNCGVTLNLDKVHTLNETITPLEIMLSESQERMVFTVDDDGLDELFLIAKKYELQVSVIGEMTSSSNYEICYEDKVLALLPYDVLARAPLYDLEPQEFLAKADEPKEFNEKNILELICDDNFCSKNYIYEQYDHTVQGRNVIAPECSKVSAFWLYENDMVVGFSMDSNPKDVFENPYKGSFESLIESYKNLISAGFAPRGFTNCLNFGNPQKSDVAYQFCQTIRAMKDFGESFNIPVVSGNVSFYNECAGAQEGRRIYPTPTFAMMGVANYSEIVKKHLQVSDEVILLGSKGEFDFEQLQEVEKYLKQYPPKVCSNITRGGVFGSLFRMLERSSLGFDGSFKDIDGFEKYQNCFLIVANKLPENIPYLNLGKCVATKEIKVDDIVLCKDRLFDIYRTSLNKKMSLR